MTFVDKPVLAEDKAVVAHVHHESVFCEIIIFEILDYPADALIDAEQSFAIPAVKCVEIHLAVIHVVHAVPAITLLLDPVRFALVVFFGVSHAFRIFEFDVFVFAEVPFGRFEHGVNGFMRKIQHERLVRVAVVLHPVQHIVGEQVRNVALAFYFFAVNVKSGIEIDALSSEADPLVETGPGFVAGAAHVPFAHKGGLPAGFLQILGEEACAFRHACVIIDNTVFVGILAGQDAGTAGRAQSRRNGGVFYISAFASHTVHVRSFEEFGFIEKAHEVVAVIVAKDKDDVARFSAGIGCRLCDSRFDSKRKSCRGQSQCLQKLSAIGCLE